MLIRLIQRTSYDAYGPSIGAVRVNGGPGDEIEVPDEVAVHLLSSGQAEAAGTKRRKATK